MRQHRCSHSGCQVRNSRIVSHEYPCTPEPAREFIEVRNKDRPVQLFLRPAQPMNRHFFFQSFRCCLKKLCRGPLRLRTGERMYRRKRPRYIRAGDSREAPRRRAKFTNLRRVKIRCVARPVRQRPQKPERQPQLRHQRPEVRPIFSIPGHNVIKATQTFHNVIRMRHPQPVQPGRPDRPHPPRKPHERNVLFRAPDFGFIALRS